MRFVSALELRVLQPSHTRRARAGVSHKDQLALARMERFVSVKSGRQKTPLPGEEEGQLLSRRMTNSSPASQTAGLRYIARVPCACPAEPRANVRDGKRRLRSGPDITADHLRRAAWTRRAVGRAGASLFGLCRLERSDLVTPVSPKRRLDKGLEPLRHRWRIGRLRGECGKARDASGHEWSASEPSSNTVEIEGRSRSDVLQARLG